MGKSVISASAFSIARWLDTGHARPLQIFTHFHTVYLLAAAETMHAMGKRSESVASIKFLRIQGGIQLQERNALLSGLLLQ